MIAGSPKAAEECWGLRSYAGQSAPPDAAATLRDGLVLAAVAQAAALLTDAANAAKIDAAASARRRRMVLPLSAEARPCGDAQSFRSNNHSAPNRQDSAF